MDICNCEIPTELADIGLGSSENIGLIRRLWFQRKYSGATLNTIDPALNSPTLKATWDALIAAADSTKVVLSPILEEPATTPGGAIDYEQSNQIPLNIAEAPYELTIKGVTVDVATHNAMVALKCEVKNSEKLTAFIVNECGNIWGESSDSGVNDFRGFTIDYLHVDYDPSEMAFDTPQKFNIRIVMKAGWSKNRVSFVPADFNALDY